MINTNVIKGLNGKRSLDRVNSFRSRRSNELRPVSVEMVILMAEEIHGTTPSTL